MAVKIKNFVIYVDGMGFLTETNRPDFFFVERVDEAMTFHKREDAEKYAELVSDEFGSAWVLKKCAEVESHFDEKFKKDR